MFLTNILLSMFDKLLDTFSEFMYDKIEKKLNDGGNKICWIATILVGWSEWGNKQNFNSGPIGQMVESDRGGK
jgi:hypothetical protein